LQDVGPPGPGLVTPLLKQIFLKGYFTSGKMNVYLKWVIYVEEM